MRAAALLASASGLLLAGCQGVPDGDDVSVFRPSYLGVETRLLEGDLVQFRTAMRGARDNQDVIAYGDCAAAQYALIRGFGFARHVRTTVDRTGGIWRGDGVYTVSQSIPGGLRTIEAELALSECEALGIPAV